MVWVSRMCVHKGFEAPERRSDGITPQEKKPTYRHSYRNNALPQKQCSLLGYSTHGPGSRLKWPGMAPRANKGFEILSRLFLRALCQAAHLLSVCRYACTSSSCYRIAAASQAAALKAAPERSLNLHQTVGALRCFCEAEQCACSVSEPCQPLLCALLPSPQAAQWQHSACSQAGQPGVGAARQAVLQRCRGAAPLPEGCSSPRRAGESQRPQRCQPTPGR